MIFTLFYHIIFICGLGSVIQVRSFETYQLNYHHHANRVKREPAVWGDPAPDYSLVETDGTTTYIYALLFVDSKITDYYKDDMLKMKREVTKMVSESNQYLYQLNVRIKVIDVLPTMRADLSLYSFEEYYNKRLNLLPYHNFAALVAFRYGGGLAFVSGMCSQKTVMLTGFYPHNPEAMGGIFFHELAHLIGVPHMHPNETLDVANCACPKRSAEDYLKLTSTERKVGCLKIPGFDHDCTVQLFANYLYRNRCLSREPRTDKQNKDDGFAEWSADGTLTSICGNGIVEGTEQCDCGLQRYCREWNCLPNTCTNYIPKWIIVLVTTILGLIVLLAGILYLYLHFGDSCSISKKPKITFNMPKMSGKTQPSRILRSLAEPLNYLKRLIFRRRKRSQNRHRNLVNSKRPIFLSNTKLDPSAIVVVRTETCSNENVLQAKIERPKRPPPPPPLSSDTLLRNAKSNRPARPPPPVFHDTRLNAQDYEASCSALPSTLYPESVPVSFRPYMGHLLSPESTDRYSISRKFEDFDDED